MRIPAVAMHWVCKEMNFMFPPGKDSPCYLIVLKDKPPAQLLPSSCPPVQGCEVQISFLKEPPHTFPTLPKGAEPHRKRGRDEVTHILHCFGFLWGEKWYNISTIAHSPT